jgi:hypothetical protein
MPRPVELGAVTVSARLQVDREVQRLYRELE